MNWFSILFGILFFCFLESYFFSSFSTFFQKVRNDRGIILEASRHRKERKK